MALINAGEQLTKAEMMLEKRPKRGQPIEEEACAIAQTHALMAIASSLMHIENHLASIDRRLADR